LLGKADDYLLLGDDDQARFWYQELFIPTSLPLVSMLHCWMNGTPLNDNSALEFFIM
jgi:hypothetical protein